MICTGGIVGFFEYSLAHLEYDSLKIELEELDQEYFQDRAIVLPNPDELDEENEGCTRIIEYKHFLNEKSKKTVVAFEYPQEWIPGQLGSYKGYTMDEAIKAALELAMKEQTSYKRS